ncbi:MAG: YdcF family protein [Pseudomonadota bacterium]|nr:YdcF family protein [Pseudomonadota bacterium]
MTRAGRRPGRRGRWARRLLLAALLAPALALALSLAGIVAGAALLRGCCVAGGPAWPPGTSPAPSADAALVLGGAMEPDGAMSYGARRRVPTAAGMLERGEVRGLILSGGALVPGLPPPAIAMRDYALGLGAPAEALVLETRARTTLENLAFAPALADAHGWRSLLVVSEAWHLPRAMALVRLLGLEERMAPAATPYRTWMWTRDMPVLYLREAAAWWWNLGRAAAWAAGFRDWAGAPGFDPSRAPVP